MASFILQDRFVLFGGKVIIVGQVRSDVLRVGMTTNIEGKTMKIKAVEMAHKQVTEAKAGDNVGLLLENADAKLINNYKGRILEFV